MIGGADIPENPLSSNVNMRRKRLFPVFQHFRRKIFIEHVVRMRGRLPGALVHTV